MGRAGRLGASPAAGSAMAATAGYSGFLIGPPVMGGIATMASLQFSMPFMAAATLAIALLSQRLPAQTAATANA